MLNALYLRAAQLLLVEVLTDPGASSANAEGTLAQSQEAKVLQDSRVHGKPALNLLFHGLLVTGSAVHTRFTYVSPQAWKRYILIRCPRGYSCNLTLQSAHLLHMQALHARLG